MGDDPCKGLREKYDACFQSWIDTEYFPGKVKEAMVPCEEDLKVYHECLRTDPVRAGYLEKLGEFKKQFPVE